MRNTMQLDAYYVAQRCFLISPARRILHARDLEHYQKTQKSSGLRWDGHDGLICGVNM